MKTTMQKLKNKQSGRVITSIILFLAFVFLGVIVLGYINNRSGVDPVNFSATSLFK